MGKERKKTRVSSKIDQLPEDIRMEVDRLLMDTSNRYIDIVVVLEGKGYKVSKSSVARYAMRTNNATQRLLEAQQQAKVLIEAVKKNPDLDYTEGTLQMMMGELTQRMANAQEEWDDLPIEKAAKIVVAISRTKAYKDKVRTEVSSRLEMAFGEFRKMILERLQSDYPDVLNILNKAIDEMEQKAKKASIEDVQ